MSPGGALAPQDHTVAFYDADAELVALLADFVLDGLRLGEGVVVVATPLHLSALEQALAQRGTHRGDLQGRYFPVDAAATVQTFLVDGRPVLGPFLDTARGMLDAAAAGGRPVRLFGELVALLWERGDVVAALELESLWNELAQERPFFLLCAYPTSALVDGSRLPPLAQVCRSHSSVLGPASYDSDVVLLGRPWPNGRTQTFLPVPASVGGVRRFVSWTLRAWACEELLPDAALVVSELATNALRHADSPFEVAVSRTGDTIRLGVTDVGSGRPQRLPPSVTGMSGRGVALVAAVADRWGVDTIRSGKVVWAELDRRVLAADEMG